MTGVVPDNEKRYPGPALIDQIIAAVKSDKPLPGDPEGEAMLRASVLKAATEKTAVGPTPDLAAVVSNKTWRFSDNDLQIRAVRLNLSGETPTFELTIHSNKPGGQDIALSEPIGLDGRSRTKRTNYAFVANKGSWQDNRTFVLERRFLGNGEMVVLDHAL